MGAARVFRLLNFRGCYCIESGSFGPSSSVDLWILGRASYCSIAGPQLLIDLAVPVGVICHRSPVCLPLDSPGMTRESYACYCGTSLLDFAMRKAIGRLSRMICRLQ